MLESKEEWGRARMLGSLERYEKCWENDCRTISIIYSTHT